jgi:hypothetical protein
MAMACVWQPCTAALPADTHKVMVQAKLLLQAFTCLQSPSCFRRLHGSMLHMQHAADILMAPSGWSLPIQPAAQHCPLSKWPRQLAANSHTG